MKKRKERRKRMFKILEELRNINDEIKKLQLEKDRIEKKRKELTWKNQDVVNRQVKKYMERFGIFNLEYRKDYHFVVYEKENTKYIFRYDFNDLSINYESGDKFGTRKFLVIYRKYGGYSIDKFPKNLDIDICEQLQRFFSNYDEIYRYANVKSKFCHIHDGVSTYSSIYYLLKYWRNSSISSFSRIPRDVMKIICRKASILP